MASLLETRRAGWRHPRLRVEGAPGPLRTLTSGAVGAELTRRPVEGFSAGLVDDVNLFEWQVTIMGPPDTL